MLMPTLLELGVQLVPTMERTFCLALDMFALKMPFIWVSKLQTEIPPLIAEAEYIAMSQALRQAIPLQNLTKELSKVFPLTLSQINFHLTVHEDNLSSIAMAESQKIGLKPHILLSNTITFAAGLEPYPIPMETLS